ncbi:MAG TPA: DUF2157 domain-containing protein, partial [Candidatus Angelobacter sp.]|nr:DUF2157 domain-containing protein [Candidatus Angelobacter sp.]
VGAHLIDPATAEKIRAFEGPEKKGLRWPAALAVTFGVLMLCAGILLFVAAHWDNLAPSQRFALVLSMVAAFHVVASLLGGKVPSIGVALHVAGTVSLGAGIYLSGQIFNLEEHWPGGILLWAVGAVLAWVILRQWPQAVLAAMLIPCWLGGEWDLATEGYRGGWNIAAQGFLLLSILYLATATKEPNSHLRRGLVWIGALCLIPFIADVIGTADTSYYSSWRHDSALPVSLRILGYAAAYLPVLLFVAVQRKKQLTPMAAASAWIWVLSLVSRHRPEDNPFMYLWVALGACAFCYWGVRENRKLFINFGTAIFAIDLIGFYFSNVLDKLGRSMGLILLGVIFLAGGWVLNRLRSDLIARAATAGAI